MPGVMNGYGYPGQSAAVFDRNDLGPSQRGAYPRQESPYRTREPPADIYRRGPPVREEIYARPSVRPHSAINGFAQSSGRFDFDDRNGPNDVPIFELDHLATFTVGAKQGLATPESGLERLRHMEMTTGIWTMQCQLAVESKHIVVIDKTTGAEMERFPLEQVVDPTARMNRDGRDVYKNILIFSVLGERGRQTDSEMHIFQCISVAAQRVVDEIKMAKEGQFAGRAAYVPREPPRGYDNYNGPALRPAYTDNRREPTLPMHQMKQRTNQDNRDAESILSDRTDRDMQMLNYCFDDIEIFVGRLQQAAEAFRELEKRRQKQGKKKAPGDGLMSGRARPPPAREFVDIFQKFKLAINLLAKLKPYIHDPNAPELVHFLFTPLSLVVEASRDPRSNTPDLPAKVVAPLLSSEAKELLRNCLTTKEMELWKSLGDAWTLSRDQWGYPVPPFTPRFHNGWQPAPNVFEEGNMASRPPSNAKNGPAYSEDPYKRYGGMRDDPYGGGGGVRDEPYQRQQSSPPSRGPEPRGPEPPRGYSIPDDSYSYRKPEEPYGRSSRDYDPYMGPRAREPDIRPSNPPPTGPSGPPRSNMPQSFEDEQRAFLREIQARRAIACEVMHERESKNSKELGVKKGEFLEVLDRNRNWWKLKNSAGQVGHAPYTILQLK